MRSVLLWFVVTLFPAFCAAEPAPLLSARQPFIDMGSPPPAKRASLFSGADGGLFEPVPTARVIPPPRRLTSDAAKVASNIRALIARAEAGPDGYDAVQHGARVKPPRAPTQMTLAQIDQWIRDTPGQPHAIGRYQFIPKTLRWLVARLDLPPGTRFTPAVQDQLADLLLSDAGLEDVLRGDMSRKTFMRNLARTWAGFPLPNGESYYEGFAGNTATMSWRSFYSQMSQILS